MTIPEEMLTAYVDGELEEEARAGVERAMAADAEIAARIERHRALRRRLHAAYDPVLEEPVPGRLIEAAHTPMEGARSNVMQLRASRSLSVPRWSSRELTAIAASLILGALVSALGLRWFDGAPVQSRDGRLIARGMLSAALTTELASNPRAGAQVTIGISFLSKAGDYCRTFTLAGRSAMAGLACRERDAWQIEALARSEPEVSSSGGAYHPAASSIPRVILDAASGAMTGEPLDAHAEAAARARSWTHP